MFATPRRLRWNLGGEVHARRKVGRARKLAVRTRSWMYERPSMPRPPYIKVGAEDAIGHQGSVFASSTLREQQSDMRGKAPLPANASPEMRAESRERWSDFRPQSAKCSTQSHHSLQDSKNPRVCLKKENPQVRVDFSSVQERNPKA